MQCPLFPLNSEGSYYEGTPLKTYYEDQIGEPRIHSAKRKSSASGPFVQARTQEYVAHIAELLRPKCSWENMQAMQDDVQIDRNSDLALALMSTEQQRRVDESNQNYLDAQMEELSMRREAWNQSLVAEQNERTRRFLEQKISDRYTFHFERQEKQANQVYSLQEQECERQRRMRDQELERQRVQNIFANLQGGSSLKSYHESTPAPAPEYFSAKRVASKSYKETRAARDNRRRIEEAEALDQLGAILGMNGKSNKVDLLAATMKLLLDLREENANLTQEKHELLQCQQQHSNNRVRNHSHTHLTKGPVKRSCSERSGEDPFSQAPSKFMRLRPPQDITPAPSVMGMNTSAPNYPDWELMRPAPLTLDAISHKQIHTLPTTNFLQYSQFSPSTTSGGGGNVFQKQTPLPQFQVNMQMSSAHDAAFAEPDPSQLSPHLLDSAFATLSQGMQ